LRFLTGLWPGASHTCQFAQQARPAAACVFCRSTAANTPAPTFAALIVSEDAACVNGHSAHCKAVGQEEAQPAAPWIAQAVLYNPSVSCYNPISRRGMGTPFPQEMY